jgi:threonine dehydratase
VIPYAASEVKVAATKALGAEVVRVPVAERQAAAEAIADRDGRSMIPPFDHPGVIAGQGTVGLEIIEDAPDIDRVLVPISGGGLISGVAAAVKALSRRTQVIGVEPELAADAQESMRTGRRVTWPAESTTSTVADGLRVTSVGELPWEHLQALVDDVVTVTEDEIRSAVRRLALASRLVVEPSGAVSVAAYLSGTLPAVRRTVAVVSGGNIEPAFLAAVLADAEAEPDVSSSSGR